MNITPIINAQTNQGAAIFSLLTGKEPLTTDPVITQAM